MSEGLPLRSSRGRPRPPPPPIDSMGRQPNNDYMEHRLTALETKLDTILPTLATKADIADVRTDIHKTESSHVKWSIGLAIAVVGALIGYLNLAKPSSAPAQPQPIVIQLPAPSAPTPAPAR